MNNKCKVPSFLILFFFIIFTAYANATTLVINPESPIVGEPVTITVSNVFNTSTTVTTPGRLTIGLDDGSPGKISGPITSIGRHSFSVTHVYKKEGKYRVYGATDPGSFMSVNPPEAVNKRITVVEVEQLELEDLPDGSVGEKYSHNIGERSSRYSIKKGKLPPGLKMNSRGTISGTPTTKGIFPFTIQIRTSKGSNITQKMSISIDQGELTLTTLPKVLNVSRSGTSTKKISYSITNLKQIYKETIKSQRGEFVINGRVVGYNNHSVTINLNSNKPTTTENVTVPTSVIQKAQKNGTSKITYRRIFVGRNFSSSYGSTTIRLQSSAAGELRVTNIRLFFEENNRPIILVKRNAKDLTGVAEIHYNGSGPLKGYWKVGNRIIQRVQKHLNYGKVLTLKTPTAPKLPTYSEGAYKLRFIITEPAPQGSNINFPEAVYHVEATPEQVSIPLTLGQPKNNISIKNSKQLFTWADPLTIKSYKIHFSKPGEKQPFFTAYTKIGEYQLNQILIRKKFQPGVRYSWQVIGYNAKGEIAGQSTTRSFFIDQTEAFVPGQITFLVDNSSDGEQTLQRIIKDYNLDVIEKTVLESIDKIMVLCSTIQDVLELTEELKNETGVYLSQPNFIFTTNANKIESVEDPLRSMQSITKFLDLNALHIVSSGKNVRVAVIDTGVDLQHKDLEGNISTHLNFIDNSPYQGEIHGTAVAAIIAGVKNNFGIIGIAPDAKIIALRACRQLQPNNSAGECYSSTIAKAINKAILLKADITNLSLGSTKEDPLVSEVLNKGEEQGLIFIAPVGNNGENTEIEFPASHQAVTSVAGFDNNYSPLPNKELASQADTLAPARSVFSASPGDQHNFFDGTSFSTAYVSGIMALSLELKKDEGATISPQFTNDNQWSAQVKSFIEVY